MKKIILFLALVLPLSLVAYTTFTQNLTLKSTGPEVVALQQMLVAQGYLIMPMGVPYGYFGPLTKGAVARWQSANGIAPAAGYWGPISRARFTVLNNNLNNPLPSQPSMSSKSSSISSDSTHVSTSVSIPVSESTPVQSSAFPLHTNITAAVFWVGEPEGNGSSEDNALSAWDDEWQKSFGGFDDYANRVGLLPKGFTPKENPFYLDLPYNDFTDNGDPKSNRLTVVPWANEKNWGTDVSMMKNRWVKLIRNGVTCYGQIEDAGPYEYDDYNYVFSTTDTRPKSSTANNAGMDVSPALRDCLHFSGENNVDNKVSWQFVEAVDVPSGPWKEIITTSGINW